MASPSEWSPRRREVVWLLAGWTTAGVVVVEQEVAYRALTGAPVEWPNLLTRAVATTLVWILLSLAAIEWSRFLSPGRWSRGTLAAGHVAGVLVANGAHVLADILLYRLVGTAGWNMGFASGFVYQLVANTLFYGVVVGLWYAATASRQERERRLHAAALEAQLGRARLDALTMQLQPHFLFNTLHAITAVLYDRPQDAERMLLALGDLLRASADDLGSHFGTVAEELGLLETYLAIQAVRFGDRLRVEIAVADEVRDALIPTMILQPLVENAVKHGVSGRLDGGRIRLSAVRHDGQLVLTVSNDSPDLPPARPGVGIGLSNTRARLELLYGSAAALRVEAGAEPGRPAIAELRLPYRAGPDHPTAGTASDTHSLSEPAEDA